MTEFKYDDECEQGSPRKFPQQQGIPRAVSMFRPRDSLHAKVAGQFLPVLALCEIEDEDRAVAGEDSLFQALVTANGRFCYAENLLDFEGLVHLDVRETG